MMTMGVKSAQGELNIALKPVFGDIPLAALFMMTMGVKPAQGELNTAHIPQAPLIHDDNGCQASTRRTEHCAHPTGPPYS